MRGCSCIRSCICPCRGPVMVVPAAGCAGRRHVTGGSARRPGAVCAGGAGAWRHRRAGCDPPGGGPGDAGRADLDRSAGRNAAGSSGARGADRGRAGGRLRRRSPERFLQAALFNGPDAGGGAGGGGRNGARAWCRCVSSRNPGPCSAALISRRPCAAGCCRRLSSRGRRYVRAAAAAGIHGRTDAQGPLPADRQAGHLPTMEAPEAVSEAMDAFLDEPLMLR